MSAVRRPTLTIERTDRTLGAFVTGVSLADLDAASWSRVLDAFGNEGWHTDSSYMRVSALASVLSARVAPSHGGETEWADARVRCPRPRDAPASREGRHAHAIPTLSDAESAALLDELVTFTCRPPRTHLHRWQPGDVVIWDNRCVLHRARPYDHDEARVTIHTRIAGDPVSELAAN